MPALQLNHGGSSDVTMSVNQLHLSLVKLSALFHQACLYWLFILNDRGSKSSLQTLFTEVELPDICVKKIPVSEEK